MRAIRRLLRSVLALATVGLLAASALSMAPLLGSPIPLVSAQSGGFNIGGGFGGGFQGFNIGSGGFGGQFGGFQGFNIGSGFNIGGFNLGGGGFNVGGQIGGQFNFGGFNIGGGGFNQGGFNIGGFGGLAGCQQGFGGFGGCQQGFGGFGGQFGGFQIFAPESTLAVDERQTVTLTWSTPPPDTWRGLQTLQIRLKDAAGTALWVRWDEATDTFSLVDPGSGRVGPVGKPGSNAQLETPLAVLHLEETGHVDTGPAGPTVAVLARVSFRTHAAGRTFGVEVLATDDRGVSFGPEQIGTIRVVANDNPNARPARITIDDLAILEGDRGRGIARFTVSLSRATTNAVTVNYGTREYPPGRHTARLVGDYIRREGTLRFAPGQRVRQIDIPIVHDTAVERDERFRLVLWNAVNATIDDSVAVGTILDNDAPRSRVFVEDARANEGSGRPSSITFSVRLTRPASSPVQVNFSTEDGSAKAGRDYLRRTGSVTFAPGETVKQISVPLVPDRVREPDETFRVRLSSPAGGQLAGAVATATIANDD